MSAETPHWMGGYAVSHVRGWWSCCRSFAVHPHSVRAFRVHSVSINAVRYHGLRVDKRRNNRGKIGMSDSPSPPILRNPPLLDVF